MFISVMADKLFDPKEPGSMKIWTDTKERFLNEVQENYDNDFLVKLCDGYAPYCKHIFVPNFLDRNMTRLKINLINDR